MAAQGLACPRMVALSLSLVLGRVSKVSNQGYGEDPALSKEAKDARKAGKKLLPAILESKDYAACGAHFSDLMGNYARDGI